MRHGPLEVGLGEGRLVGRKRTGGPGGLVEGYAPKDRRLFAGQQKKARIPPFEPPSPPRPHFSLFGSFLPEFS